MAGIQEMVDRLSEWAEETTHSYDGVIHLYATEGRRGITIGKQEDIPQHISVEFADADVDEELADTVELELLRLTNGTDWEVVDEDGVYDGNRGEISVWRELPPEEANQYQHHEVASKDFE